MPRLTRIVAAGFPMHAILQGMEPSVMVFEADGQGSPVGLGPARPPAVTPRHLKPRPLAEQRPEL